MKKLSILAMGLLFVLTTACSVSGSGTLFDGKDSNKWKMTGDVSVQDDIMTLKGTDALVVLKNGKYKNFDLTLDLRTTPGGKGAVWFHTDPNLKKGYRIAINNDRADDQKLRKRRSMVQDGYPGCRTRDRCKYKRRTGCRVYPTDRTVSYGR